MGYRGELIKLKHRTDAELSINDYDAVPDLAGFPGTFTKLPASGNSFSLQGEKVSDYIRTSTITSVLVNSPESGFDKLVLPDTFPNRETLVLPDNMAKGDMLLATLNSIYFLRNITEEKTV